MKGGKQRERTRKIKEGRKKGREREGGAGREAVEQDEGQAGRHEELPPVLGSICRCTICVCCRGGCGRPSEG